MTRPEKPIDWDRVDQLLICGCLGTEIAACFDMHADTFYRKVEEKYNIGFTAYSSLKRNNGDALLREVQFQKAMERDNTMMIWLGKNRLGQAESPQEISVSQETMKNFKAIMCQISNAQSVKSDLNTSQTNVSADHKS